MIEELYNETDDRIGEIAEKLNEVIRLINKLEAKLYEQIP